MVYVNLVMPPEALAWPSTKDLRPTTAALLDHLFDRGGPRVPAALTPTMPSPSFSPATAAACAGQPPGTWPDIRELALDLGLPVGSTARPLAPADVPRLIAALPRLDPQLEADPL